MRKLLAHSPTFISIFANIKFIFEKKLGFLGRFELSALGFYDLKKYSYRPMPCLGPNAPRSSVMTLGWYAQPFLW